MSTQLASGTCHWSELALFGLQLPCRACCTECTSSGRALLRVGWTIRARRLLTLPFGVTLLESKLARTLLGTAPGRRSTGVRRRSSQLGGRGGWSGSPSPLHFLPPPPPSVQGGGNGEPELLPPPWVNSPSPARPAGLRRASGQHPGSCLAATCVAARFWRVRSSRPGTVRVRDVRDPRACV